MRTNLVSFAYLAILVVLACDTSTDPARVSSNSSVSGYYCAPQGSYDSLTNSQLDSLSPPPSGRSNSNANDDWAWLASRVPGCWAGMYVQTDSSPAHADTLVLLLVDTTQRGTAIDSLREYEPSIFVSPNIKGVRANVAGWSWLQLYDWHKYLLFLPHTGFDASKLTGDAFNTSANRLELDVASSTDSVSMVQLLRTWHSPASLIEVKISNSSFLLKRNRR